MGEIMVVGASGVLGGMICGEVRRLLPGSGLAAAGRAPERTAGAARRLGADRSAVLDVSDPGSVRAAVKGADLVIAAVGQTAPHIQEACLESGVHCVDVGTDGALARRVRAFDSRARAAGLASISMAGLYPGLSGLLIARAATAFERVDHVDLSFLQNTNAHVGRTGTVDMLRLVTAPVTRGTRTEPGFRRRHPVDRRMRMIDHPERHVLMMELALTSIDYWTAWNSAAFSTLISALARIRAVPRHAARLASLTRHDDRRPETVELRADVHGVLDGRASRRTLSLTTGSDYRTTAAAAAALGALALDGRATGAGPPIALTTLAELTERMELSGLRIHRPDGPAAP